MPDRYFLDTNILVYTFDDREVGKKTAARELVSTALADGLGLISYQVVQEFLNVATQKFSRPLDASEARRFLDQVLAPLCEVFASITLYRRALEVRDRWRYGLHDSLIIAAALEAECSTLLSEDLQHGQQIERLVIVNPFASLRP